MGKGKLAKFADMAANPLVVERPYRPGDEVVRSQDHVVLVDTVLLPDDASPDLLGSVHGEG